MSSIISNDAMIDLNFQFVPFGSYAALHYYSKRVDNKYQSHTDNGILLMTLDLI